MDSDLDTIRWHLDRLLDHRGASTDARDELNSAFKALDQRLRNIEAALAELMRPPAPHGARVQPGVDPT